MNEQPLINDAERADLVSYLDGELDAEAARAVETRLNTDPRVRAEADALQRTWELLDHLPRPEPSANFTHRTLDRVSVLRPAAPRTGRCWLTTATWAASGLIAFALGGVCALGLVRLFPASERSDRQLTRDLPVVENLHAYRLVDDAGVLRALDSPDLFGEDLSDPVAAAPLSVNGPVPEPTAEELEQNRKLFERWRADPGHLARLRQNLVEFTELPVERQESLRRLDRSLREEDSVTQLRLWHTLQRYEAWLGRLSSEDRQALAATEDPDERLRRIKEIRERDWLASLPAAQRQEVEGKQGAERTALLEKWREEDRRRRAEWADVVRANGSAADRSHAAGLRLIDFPPEVQTFEHESLRPLLSNAERTRLDKAEGQGVLYARTLQELTDKYGWAIPGSADTKKPTSMADLRQHYQRLVPQTPKEKETADEMQLLAKMRGPNQKWPEFGVLTMELSRLRKHPLTPQPLWAPCHPGDFEPAIRLFLDRNRPLLGPDSEGGKKLSSLEGQWPGYPQALYELAKEAGLSVPGMSLPGPRPFWNNLLVGLPEVPDGVLLEFAVNELTAEERTTLKVSSADPTSRERLKETYYSRHPDRLPEQVRGDYQKQARKSEEREAGR